MTNGLNSFLNSLAIDPNGNWENYRFLTREQSFVLTWMALNQKNRSYSDLIRDGQLKSFQECEAIVQELIDLGMLRSRSVRGARSR